MKRPKTDRRPIRFTWTIDNHLIKGLLERMKQPYRFYPFYLSPKYSDKGLKIYHYANLCVVNKPPGTQHHPIMEFACGYCVIPKSDVPKEWWGNGDFEGSHELDIHGGITYCVQIGCNTQEEVQKQYKERLNDSPPDSYMVRIKYINHELAKDPTGYIVFGFDCGHAGDHHDPKLKDMTHITHLTLSMHAQLIMFAQQYELYKKLKDSHRDTLMELVRERAVRYLKEGLSAIPYSNKDAHILINLQKFLPIELAV